VDVLFIVADGGYWTAGARCTIVADSGYWPAGARCAKSMTYLVVHIQ